MLGLAKSARTIGKLYTIFCGMNTQLNIVFSLGLLNLFVLLRRLTLLPLEMTPPHSHPNPSLPTYLIFKYHRNLHPHSQALAISPASSPLVQGLSGLLNRLIVSQALRRLFRRTTQDPNLQQSRLRLRSLSLNVEKCLRRRRLVLAVICSYPPTKARRTPLFRSRFKHLSPSWYHHRLHHLYPLAARKVHISVLSLATRENRGCRLVDGD